MGPDRLRQLWTAATASAALMVVMGVGAPAGARAQTPGHEHAPPQHAQPQTGQQQTGQTVQQPTFDHPDPVPPDVRGRMDAERSRMANDDRHKRLAQDADKLVALSNELKTDVSKTGKDELSMDVIRKAAEIEKLAHDVQSRMKN